MIWSAVFMISWYQHLPEYIDPVAISFGMIALHWYALTYMLALGVCGTLAYRGLQRYLSSEDMWDMVTMIGLGIVLGGRIGYVLFYNFPFYKAHPLAIISPFNSLTGEWIGIAGMSYYGGLFGAGIGLWLFARARNKRFLPLADALASVAPIGYFFGRVGNFINGELYGRVTDGWWGMYFPQAPTGERLLRHPSQLYEAFFEGIVLFVILKFIAYRKPREGCIVMLSIGLYTVMRWCLEFVREPDPQLGLLLWGWTLGQWISFGVAGVATVAFGWMAWHARIKCVILSRD